MKAVRLRYAARSWGLVVRKYVVVGAWDRRYLLARGGSVSMVAIVSGAEGIVSSSVVCWDVGL